MKKSLITATALAGIAAGSLSLAATAQADVVRTANIKVTRTCIDANQWSVRVDLNVTAGKTYGLRVIDKFQNGPVATNFAKPVASFTFTRQSSFQPIVLVVSRKATNEGVRLGVSRRDICGAR